MRNLAITYSIAYAAALGLLLELPANAISKDKSKGKTKTQSRIWASPYGTSVWPHGKDKIIQPAGISKVVKESNHQALKLLADLTKSEKRDVVISPVASTAVYLLLLNGLRGDSRAKLAQAMKVDKTGEVLLANMTAAYLKSLSSTTPKCEVGVVGATNAPFSFQPQYSKLLKDKFGGLVLNDTQHQLNELRDYIKRKTAGQFGDTAQGPQPLSIDLYSTLHFNGEWSDKFQTAETHRADFYKDDGTTVLVPMMYKFYEGLVLHLSAKHFQALRIPYLPSQGANDVFDAMYIILPNKGLSLDKLLGELANTGLDSYSSAWRAKQGDLTIPRFKIDTNELDIPLPTNNGRVIKLSKADIAAMCHNSTSPDNIKTKQWTSLDFNENGTIAASLTECSISVGSDPIEKFSMKVDRPFAFILGNSRTGTFLFAGAVQDPKDSKMAFAQAEQEWLKRVAATNKKDPDNYCWMVRRLAKFYTDEGKFPQAEVLLTEVSNTVDPESPTHTDVLFDLAQTLVEEKKYESADQTYRRLLLIQKRNTEASSLYYEPNSKYKLYLDGYAHLLSLMKADLSSVHKEQEDLYKRIVHSELEYFAEISSGDSGERKNAVDHIVDAKVQLAEFYASSGNKEEARKTYGSAIASIFASPEPDYCRAIKLGKTYSKMLKEARLDWESSKIQSDLNNWTQKINSPAKRRGKGQLK